MSFLIFNDIISKNKVCGSHCNYEIWNLTICIKMFDKVKLSNLEKVKKVVVLDDL